MKVDCLISLGMTLAYLCNIITIKSTVFKVEGQEMILGGQQSCLVLVNFILLYPLLRI